MKLITLFFTFIVLIKQSTSLASSEYRNDHHNNYYVPKPNDAPLELKRLQLSFHHLKEKVGKCCEKVAFSAARMVKKFFKKGEKVPFETVWLNVGLGYNKDTGVFRAQKPGLYSFSATIMSYQSTKTVECVLVVNNAYQAKIYGSLNYASGAVTAVIQLQPGDEVFIELLKDGGIYGKHWSSFSGHLV